MILRKVLLLSLLGLVVFTAPVLSQKKEKTKGLWLLSVGMGVDYGSTPSFREFTTNEMPIDNPDSISTFYAGVEFFGGIEYVFAKNLAAKLDYSYYIRSNRYSYGLYVFDFSISAHQPYLMIFFRSPNPKFRFKLGAGAGYHLHYLDYEGKGRYDAGAVSFRTEFVFAPKFSDKLETYISGFAYGTTASSLKDSNGNLLKASGSDLEVNMGGFGVGARLGLSFYLN